METTSAVTPPEHFILISGEAEKPAEESKEHTVKPAATRARKGRASEAARFKNG